MITTNSEFDSAQNAYSFLIDYFKKDNAYLNFDSNIVVVDVGAGMPQYYSNSNFFREKNSKVICIEPNPNFCQMFKQNNLNILEYAVTKEDIGELDFIEFPNDQQSLGGSSLLQDCQVLDYHGIQKGIIYKVKALSLNTILKTHHPEITHIDILDIDTEGNELDVLQGLDLDKYKPKVMIIENLHPNDNKYYDFYKKINYSIVGKCSHNDILVRNN